MSPSELVTWLILASFVGWVFESTWNVAREGRWDKRGFLFGPVCPIYGLGTVAAIILFDNQVVESGAFPAWAVFLTCMAGSAAMEYLVSFALERLFGAVWWDYSNMPLNLKGRICLPASLLFGTAGLALVFFVFPMIHQVEAIVPSTAFELFALVAVFLIGADLAATVLALRDLMGKIVALDEQVNSKMDAGTQNAKNAILAVREGLSRRQLRMLTKLRRFSSDTIRERVTVLREGLQDRYAQWREK